jgi:FMN phosphatase YigB (HAD superfamily)
MIGDSLENDITPARALGMQTIHFGSDIIDTRINE